MVDYSISDLRPGLKVVINGSPWIIKSKEFVKPGKGQVFVRTKFVNLQTGANLEQTLKSGDTLTQADVIDCEVQFLYQENELYYFMDLTNYDHHQVKKETLKGQDIWLNLEDSCILRLWDQNPIALFPPQQVCIKVESSEPGVKGDTQCGATKNATLENGLTIQVPLFIEAGNIIKVNTVTKQYISRV